MGKGEDSNKIKNDIDTDMKTITTAINKTQMHRQSSSNPNLQYHRTLKYYKGRK